MNGGSINYSDASNVDDITDFNIELTMNCTENDAFESGTITKTCNVKVGEWVENATTASCALKTCGAKTFYLDRKSSTPKVLFMDLPGNSYYSKSSGYKGSLTINGKSYAGYEKSQTCATGYTCKNCNNNMVSYTCDFDTNGILTWKEEGECVPNTCSYASLKTSCANKAGCKEPSFPSVKTNSTVVFDDGSSAKGNNYTVGTKVELECGSGYWKHNIC